MVNAYFIVEADFSADWDAQAAALLAEDFSQEVTRIITPCAGFLLKVVAEDTDDLEQIDGVLHEKYHAGTSEMMIVA